MIWICAGQSAATLEKNVKLIFYSRPWMEPAVQMDLGALMDNVCPTLELQELQVSRMLAALKYIAESMFWILLIFGC